jgi:serine/threonine protein kinase
MSQPTTCPESRDLQEYASGQTSGPDAEGITQHLKDCARCREIVSRLQNDTAPGSAVSPPPEPGEPGGAVGPERPAGSAPPAFDFLSAPQASGELGWLGGYRVQKLLGQGGMGLVFLAEDVGLQRPVALKVLLPQLSGKPVYHQRFLREARAAAALKSDHVVTIYQVGEHNGLPFLAMEFLRGGTLEGWLKPGQRPTVPQAVRLGKEIALGLAAAHARGLIHRDIKPANIWLEAPKGRVKILDFGLARPVNDDENLTHSGLIVGTPAYMSPEQARGEALDPRCDLFSLGCVLYELLAGRLPFQGPTVMAKLTALMVDEPPPLMALNPEIPSELGELVQRLLSKKPADRPPSARVVAENLQQLERALVARVAVSPAAPEEASVTQVATPERPAESREADSRPPSARPPSTKGRSKRPTRFRQSRVVPLAWVTGLAVIGLLMILGVVAGAVLYVRAGKATLEMVSDDPNARVIIERKGQPVAILDRGSNRIQLPAGEYEFKLEAAPPWLRVSPERLTVARGEQHVVAVTKSPPPPGPGPHQRPGTVEMVSDDPNVRVIVERHGERIAVLERGRSRFELPAGEYELKLDPAPPWLRVSPERLRVGPGEKHVVSVRRQPPPPGPGPPRPQGPGSPENRALRPYRQVIWHGSNVFRSS